MAKTFQIQNLKVGGKNPFVLMSGPCVLEDRKTVFAIARKLKEITDKLNVPFIFKASYDKANRTSVSSFRGPGIREGLALLAEIKQALNVPVMSDVHTPEECAQAAEVLDVLQIPAFLCRQTDLLVAAGNTKRPISVKKGQFLAPTDMAQVIKKIESTGNKKILLAERGTTFGYNNLVTDFRSLEIMRGLGFPVVIDASHSVQQPGGKGSSSGGNSEHIPLLARCGVAAGCDAVFMETHINPSKALSDGPNMIPLSKMEALLKDLKAIDKVVRK